MAWTIEYADTAKGQLRKLDKTLHFDRFLPWADSQRSANKNLDLAGGCFESQSEPAFGMLLAQKCDLAFTVRWVQGNSALETT